VLHIATHGAFRPDNPMFSGLRLSDGWLAARDLYGMRLQAALVVLSACETGLFGQGSGDEVLGLARGFLYAGAPSLVTSLWPVHDEHTAELMAEFYTRLRQGTPVAAALREAQLALKERHPNPYYWAAFTITGDPQRTIEA
jgi:CHAT domain-containing protein